MRTSSNWSGSSGSRPRPARSRSVLAAGLALSIAAPALAEPVALLMPAQVLGASANDSTAAPRKSWRDALPLMKEEALSRGYTLPKAFGTGVIYTYIDRLIEVTDVRVGVDGGPPQSVSSYIELGSRSFVHNVNGKFDVFLLPFLNLYGVLGYVKNYSTTRARVTVPRPPPSTGTVEFETEIPTELDGVVGGAGLTLAAGYDDFFLTVDGIWAQSDIGFDDWLRAGVVSVRSGWNGKIRGRSLQVWAGGTRWDTRTTVSGSTDVPSVGHVVFEADQGPLHDANWNLGTNLWIGGSWQVIADYGFDFNDVHILTLGGVFRFQ